MFVWAIIIILIASIVGIFIYYNEKNKNLEAEAERLKKLMISSGYNFEQLEFRLEEIKILLKKSMDSEDLKSIKDSLTQINRKINHILKSINSTNKS